MKPWAWFGGGLVVFVLAVMTYLWLTPGRTPPISAPQSVASLERNRIGGVNQCVLIRGNDASNPVVLFRHGVPGMPAMYLSHAWQDELEKEVVVVQCDRRGAGKSYREDLGGTLNTEQLVADAVELTNLLGAQFHQEKIYLIGTSGEATRVWW